MSLWYMLGGGENLTPRSESATAAIQVRFDCILFENLDEPSEEGKPEYPNHLLDKPGVVHGHPTRLKLHADPRSEHRSVARIGARDEKHTLIVLRSTREW